MLLNFAKVLYLALLTLPVSIPDEERKLTEIFFFQTSLCYLKRFYEGLKGLHKTFWGTKKKCKSKGSWTPSIKWGHKGFFSTNLRRISDGSNPSMRNCYEIKSTLAHPTIWELYYLLRFLSHVMPLVFYYAPWKHQETSETSGMNSDKKCYIFRLIL